MVEAGKNAKYLELALRAHPFVIPVESVEIGPYRQTGGTRGFPVTDDEIEFLCFFPGDVGIPVKRNEVVGNRPVHRILEVENARIGGSGRISGHRRLSDEHQIARVVVPMDKDLRLRQIVIEERSENGAQIGHLTGVERKTEVPGDIPVRKQVEFSLQQRAVVHGQNAGAAGALECDERGVGVTVERGRRLCVEYIQVGGAAEVGEQQKSLFKVGGEHFGNMDARLMKQRRDADERAAVFVFRRGIHDDARRAVGQIQAKITAETGVG